MHPGKTLLHANAVIKEETLNNVIHVAEQVEEVENDKEVEEEVCISQDEEVQEMQVSVEIKND